VRTAEKTALKVRKLRKLLSGGGTLLIVLQDNPDPDCIASAVALRKLANNLGALQCSLVHGGTVGRGENRALVRYLGLNLRGYEGLEPEKFDLVAMVDTQPGVGNNSLPAGVEVKIVIDHHPVRRASRMVTFTDIRSGYGATSTILLEYLLEAGIEPDMPLATALLYGIRSDTQDLGREASRAEMEAIEYLYPRANKRMLSEIQRGKVPRAYYQMLADALVSAKVCGKAIVTGLGQIDNPDMIAEVADLLLRDDETSWTLCTGVFRGKLLISIRTSEEGKSAEQVVRRLVARRGSGGGHQSYAGGQIPLRKGTKGEQEELERMVEQRFLRAVGVNGQRFERLVRR